MEWLLGDGYVLSASIEYRLKRAITFDTTVGSRLNFYSGFQRIFSLGKLWNHCSEEGCLVGNLEYRLKRAITFYPIV
jgi:hypothetical protein